VTGKDRRTLKDIQSYPDPKDIYQTLMESEGWPYKVNKQYYMQRDRSLVALIYLLALRISEALRLRKNQFIFNGNGKDRIVVQAIKLSKSRVKDRPRKEQYRQVNYLPLVGERAKLTEFVTDYLEILEPDELLFKFKGFRAWQIVTALTGETCHWFRAYGEDYLYMNWDKDILAVADYVKVEPRTLQEYIRRRFEKYKVV